VLRDSNGKERAKLGVTDVGSVALEMFDSMDRKRMVLFVAADGRSALAMYNQEGELRLVFGASLDGTGLHLQGPDGKNTASLLLESTGDAHFNVRDSRGLSVVAS
jgi:hypothetical protein